MQFFVKSTAFACLFLAVSGTAQAQVTPDITDAINSNDQIENALDDQWQNGPRIEMDDEGLIDGEAGIYVLTVNDIFYVGGSAGGGWSQNPTRTVDDLGSSFFADAAARVGLQTKISSRVDFGVSASVSGVEYEADFAPSSRTVTASVNAGMPIGGTPFYISVSGFGGRSYNSDFKNGTGFYGASLALSGGVKIGPRTIVRGSANGGRQEGSIEENNAWNANVSLDISHLVVKDVTIGASAAVGRIWFDDFYEDVTFVSRKDWQYSGNINASWSPTSWLSVSSSAGYAKRDSAFFLSNYDGFEARLTLAARKRF